MGQILQIWNNSGSVRLTICTFDLSSLKYKQILGNLFLRFYAYYGLKSDWPLSIALVLHNERIYTFII